MEPKDEIKQKLNIVDVIGEYLELRNAGSGSFKAVCPFHNEKTPSFYVSQEKQIWHCFGCNKGGDVIAFVMEIEGINFFTALKQLGLKVGVEIKDLKPDRNRDEKELLLDANELAKKFYQKILSEHELGLKAREYIKTRKIDEDLVTKFGLGVAPDRWTVLSDFLLKRGIAESTIIKAGLAKKKQSGSGIIDRFRNRLVIPLTSSSGRVLGFTGRLLESQSDKTGPKYLNSPETLIYHKSDVLYGLYLAKQAVRKEKSLIIVEGNLDVVASHKVGVKNVVASSGTALTDSQLRQIKNITNKLLFCFDADLAGFAAAKRGIRLAQGMDFDISVISIPKELGKDPDDIVQNDPEKWKELVKNPIHIMQYFIDKGLQDLDLSDVDSKQKFVDTILTELSFLKNKIRNEHWLQQLADISRIDIGVLRNSLLTMPNNATKMELREKKIIITSKQVRISRYEHIASIIVGILLNKEDLIPEVLTRLSEDKFPNGLWREVYKNIVLNYNQSDLSGSPQKQPLYALVQNQLSGEVRETLLKTEELINAMNEQQVREELYRHVDTLIIASIKKRRKLLEADIRQAEMSGNREKLEKLLKEYKLLLSN